MTTQTEAGGAATAPIADTIADLTPDWFTEVLRQAGTIAAPRRVTAVRTEAIGTGQVGLVVRAVIEYDHPGHGAPPSLVVKLPSADPGSRQMGVAMGLYEAEVRFYQEIAGRLGRSVPTMHWGEVDPPTGRFTLVLDDLTRTSQVGDMVAGCSLEQAALAMAALPALQAPVWDDPGLPGRPWLDPVRTDMMFAAVAPTLDPFLERFAGQLEPEHVALVRRLAPNAGDYRTRVWTSPYVVAHSDYRLDNMLFATAAGAPPISIVDWQGARLGPPLLDAAVLLGACMSTEQRRAHERELLRDYHDRLVSAGIGGFSFDDCVESYRRCSLWPFLLGIPVSVSLVQTERGDEMWARLVRGCAELVIDTGAAELLE
jgi:Phosphotransferase enzyme family